MNESIIFALARFGVLDFASHVQSTYVAKFILLHMSHLCMYVYSFRKQHSQKLQDVYVSMCVAGTQHNTMKHKG